MGTPKLKDIKDTVHVGTGSKWRIPDSITEIFEFKAVVGSMEHTFFQ